ncbi:hypothetical protein ABKV19_014272 [Rosa sericea]
MKPSSSSPPSSSSLPSPPSSPPSSSSSKDWMYDVFLSFRGKDTRNSFADHLYAALDRAGVQAFRDAERLRRGKVIGAELTEAIQQSRISLVVLSKRYAESSWCLDELMQIMECRKIPGQMVFPIFYHVRPSDVRNQSGSFFAPFYIHEHSTGIDKISKWRAALRGAANLSGWHLGEDGSEADTIKSIVNQISSRLNNTYLNVAIYPVGIPSRVEDISKCLGVGLDDDVRIVGIWGMGGIGKTTVAKAIYNKFYHCFETKSYLADVRETAKESNGKITLQERLLSDILKPTKIVVDDVSRGINVIKERLRCKKVFVIVDDVDDVDQLNALAMGRDSFGPGSRIIITTRDRHLLELLEVNTIHLTREMNEEEALELFSWHAFQNHCPNVEYIELSRRVVGYCEGLPLALEVLGSFLDLCKRGLREWASTLKKLEKIPDVKIQSKLRISFDAIDENERNMFLHISCFFIGMDKNHVIYILEGCGLYAEIGFSVLLQRFLVTVSEKNKVMMHGLLRDMGREIVRVQWPCHPERRSRVWLQEDVIELLTDESGTEDIEGLALNLQRSDNMSFSTEAFRNLKRLQLLQLNYVQLTGDCQKLSKKLRWLCLRGFPLQVIRNEFLNELNLVSIDLRHSNLVRIWEDSRLLETLKILNLSHSHDLIELPDFSNLPNLEYLILKDCKSLSEIHESVGRLERLAVVNLKDCIMLKDLPKSFYELQSVKTLVLSGCSGFANLDEDIGKMISLRTLLVSGTSITEIPSSVQRLLPRLDFSSRQSLKQQTTGLSHD